MVSKKMRIATVFFIGVVATLTGCASWDKQQTQTVSVQTFKASEPLAGVTCELSNDLGQWTLTTPGSVEVIQSAEDLSIRCSDPEQSNGLARAVASPSPGYLNHPAYSLAMLAVAGANLAKQLTTGVTQVYPSRVQIMMDQDIIITATQ